MTTVKLTKEQKASAKREAAMRKLAIRVKKKFPDHKVKYSEYEVTLCLGWDWYKDKKLAKIADRADNLFSKPAKTPGTLDGFGVAADISGHGIKTLTLAETIA